MVSAKFHVIGDDGDWFRVRLQEEIYAHGLEGSVLKAAEKNLAVVVEGDSAVVKRMHGDVVDLCPKKVRCTDIVFDKHRPQKKARTYTNQELSHAIMELERKMTRMDQNVAKILALLEGGWRPNQTSQEEPRMDVKEEAADGFASMFGN
jgi:acylphosphatase